MGRPIRIKLRNSPSLSVGAGVGMVWGGGLYGRPRGPPPGPSPAPPTVTLVQEVRRATIKTLPALLHHPRPHGIPGRRLRLTPIGRPQGSPPTRYAFIRRMEPRCFLRA